MVNHIGIFGSKAAEGLSAFQRRSCYSRARCKQQWWTVPLWSAWGGQCVKRNTGQLVSISFRCMDYGQMVSRPSPGVKSAPIRLMKQFTDKCPHVLHKMCINTTVPYGDTCDISSLLDRHVVVASVSMRCWGRESKTTLQRIKQFDHNVLLPCCQCMETCSRVSRIQNNIYAHVPGVRSSLVNITTLSD